MDLNVNIIRNVKMFPQLYEKKCSHGEREKAWKFLAKVLKLDEQILKRRWHILREYYTKQFQNVSNKQSRTPFKYSKEMDFLRGLIKIPEIKIQDLRTGNWVEPEFVITAADLEAQTPNSKENEEILFMEIEESTEDSPEIVPNYANEVNDDSCQEVEVNVSKVEVSNQEIGENSIVEDDVEIICQETENDSNEDDKSKALENEHVEEDQKIEEIQENRSDSPYKPEPIELTKELEPTQMQQDAINSNAAKNELEKGSSVEQETELFREEEESKEKVIVEQIVPPITMPVKVVEERETVFIAASTKKSDGDVVRQSVDPPASGTRCEDAIFGELVVAMLKSMDPVKKKSIKKEIMNLLFS